MFTNLFKIIGSGLIALGALFGASQNYGSVTNTTPTGTVPAVFETYLSAQQATGDTTMTLASGSLRDGTSLSGYACFTIDSNTSSLEYECGTVSGTSVTNVLRGIDATTGTTSISSLIYTHRRGADVKITDYPALTIATNQLNGTQTIPNELQYANTVLIGTNDASTTVATKYYVDTQGTVGLVNATTLVRGIVQLATAAQAALGTILGTTGANLALPASMATSTPTFQGTNVIPVTGTNNKLSQLFLDLTQAFTFTGTVKLATTTTIGSGAQGGLVPPGSVTAYATTTAPAGWLLCNGTSYATSTYPLLFAVIGYSYGGSSANFNVPNLSGRDILMASSSANLGQSGGESNHTLQNAELPAFTVHLTYGNGSGGNLVTGGANSPIGSTAESNSPGSGVPFNVLNPYLVLNYIIKY